MIRLIINADDFGMSQIFNESILNLCENQHITSTSVMITKISENQRHQINSLLQYSNNTLISIGLHLNFSSFDYLTQLKSQISDFRHYFQQNPSHIDIHKYHKMQHSYNIIDEYCLSQNIPIRNHGINHVAKTTDFLVCFGTYKSQTELIDWINQLEDNKTYEILFHPGKYDSSIKSSLNQEREKDIENILFINSYIKNFNLKKITYNELSSQNF